MSQQWYALVDAASGAALSYTTDPPTPLPAGTASVPIDHQPGAGEAWDAAARAVASAPPDPAWRSDWYAYYDPPTGALAGVGQSATPPSGRSAVRLTDLPGVDDAWSTDARAFVPRTGARAQLEARRFDAVAQRIASIEALRDRAGILGLPDADLSGFRALLDARTTELQGLIVLMISAYLQAS